METTVRPPEKEIYTELWTKHKEYREVAPGEEVLPVFLKQVNPPFGSSVIDFGCGTGRASLLMALPPPMGANLKVTMVDFVPECLDPDIREMLKTQAHALTFVEADLTKEIPVKPAPYGFISDVMEHIPTNMVNRVLNNVLMAAQHVFFCIATKEDRCGKLVGHELHLTVKPYEWWLQRFRDRDCLVHWSQECEGYCFFYVTAWIDAKTIVDVGTLNISEETAKANVRTNCSAGWRQVEPHDTNSMEAMILGGGWSLSEFEDEIKERRAQGVKLITMNGTYNWCLDRGLIPSAQVIVDARPHNARFSKPVVDNCRYLISSQCDPSVLEGLPHDRTFLWHGGAELHRPVLDEIYDKKWWWVPGGSTVLLRTIPLMRLLGYRKFTLYGCDSCVFDGRDHHAYKQPENDGQILLPQTISVDGKPTDRVFLVTTWMASQASEFIQIIRMMANEIELEVRGDGLLAYIVNTAAGSESGGEIELV